MASGVPANGQDCGHIRACPVSFGCAPRQPSRCSRIVRVHAEKLLLCDRLEAIAERYRIVLTASNAWSSPAGWCRF